MKPLLITQLGLALALVLTATESKADSDSAAHLVQHTGALTDVAGIESALVDSRIVLFIDGYARKPVRGDTIVCNKVDQEVTMMANRFRSNPFTAQHAATLERMDRKGYHVLDAGCVIGSTSAEAVALFRSLGGVIDDIAVPVAMLPDQQQ